MRNLDDSAMTVRELVFRALRAALPLLQEGCDAYEARRAAVLVEQALEALKEDHV